MFSKLFKKKPSQSKPPQDEEDQSEPKIVIGVPGKWPERNDLMVPMFERGYTMADIILLQTGTDKNWRVDIYDKDPNLPRAFQIAGRGLLENDLLAEIGAHSFTVYVQSPQRSVEAARDLGKVGCALLDSGGLAVKVESAGIAHSASTWQKLVNSDSLFDLMSAYVTYIGDKKFIYSCGMHNFGLPDCSLSAVDDLNEAGTLLSWFNFYQLQSNPQLKDGQTFDLNKPPVYRLTKTVDKQYPPSHLFHNPHGRWHLTKT